VQAQQKVKHEGATSEGEDGNRALWMCRFRRRSRGERLVRARRSVQPAMLREMYQALCRLAHAQMIYPTNRDKN
jgi:hypothetical protein